MLFELINHHISPSNSKTAVIDSSLNIFSYTDLFNKIKEIETQFQSSNLSKGLIVILKYDKSFLGLAYLLTCLN